MWKLNTSLCLLSYVMLYNWFWELRLQCILTHRNLESLDTLLSVQDSVEKFCCRTSYAEINCFVATIIIIITVITWSQTLQILVFVFWRQETLHPCSLATWLWGQEFLLANFAMMRHRAHTFFCFVFVLNSIFICNGFQISSFAVCLRIYRAVT
jgi:hypothetical protein